MIVSRRYDHRRRVRILRDRHNHILNTRHTGVSRNRHPDRHHVVNQVFVLTRRYGDLLRDLIVGRGKRPTWSVESESEGPKSSASGTVAVTVTVPPGSELRFTANVPLSPSSIESAVGSTLTPAVSLSVTVTATVPLVKVAES